MAFTVGSMVGNYLKGLLNFGDKLRLELKYLVDKAVIGEFVIFSEDEEEVLLEKLGILILNA